MYTSDPAVSALVFVSLVLIASFLVYLDNRKPVGYVVVDERHRPRSSNRFPGCEVFNLNLDTLDLFDSLNKLIRVRRPRIGDILIVASTGNVYVRTLLRGIQPLDEISGRELLSTGHFYRHKTDGTPVMSVAVDAMTVVLESENWPQVFRLINRVYPTLP